MKDKAGNLESVILIKETVSLVEVLEKWADNSMEGFHSSLSFTQSTFN